MAAAAAIRRRKFSGRELSCSRKFPKTMVMLTALRKHDPYFRWDMTDMGRLLTWVSAGKNTQKGEHKNKSAIHNQRQTWGSSRCSPNITPYCPRQPLYNPYIWQIFRVLSQGYPTFRHNTLQVTIISPTFRRHFWVDDLPSIPSWDMLISWNKTHLKINGWNMSSWRWGRSCSFLNGWFVGSMLIFRGVRIFNHFLGLICFLTETSCRQLPAVRKHWGSTWLKSFWGCCWYIFFTLSATWYHLTSFDNVFYCKKQPQTTPRRVRSQLNSLKFSSAHCFAPLQPWWIANKTASWQQISRPQWIPKSVGSTFIDLFVGTCW